MDMVPLILTFVLMLISAINAIGILHKRNMWIFICMYWIVVFIRYSIELLMKVGAI